MPERVVFDFSLQGENEKDRVRIFYAKGGYYGIFVWWLLSIFVVLLFSMPPAKKSMELTFKGFITVGIIFIIYQYYKIIIKISIDEENLSIMLWRNEKKIPLEEIKKIKLTYHALYGSATMRIKGTRNRFYIIWAPTFDERYELYLKLKDCLSRRNLL